MRKETTNRHESEGRRKNLKVGRSTPPFGGLVRTTPKSKLVRISLEFICVHSWFNKIVPAESSELERAEPENKPFSSLIRFAADVEVIIQRRPQAGALFPYLRAVRAGDRATEFTQRCDDFAPALLRRERRWVRSLFSGGSNAALVALINSSE